MFFSLAARFHVFHHPAERNGETLISELDKLPFPLWEMQLHSISCVCVCVSAVYACVCVCVCECVSGGGRGWIQGFPVEIIINHNMHTGPAINARPSH